MYTTSEVKESLAGLNDDQHATYALQVADFFRRRANLPLLELLLVDEDISVVTLGSWVAGEVIDASCGRELFRAMCNLLVHTEPSIRFEAIKPVAALVQPADQDELVQLLMLVADTDASVRSRALRIACLVDDDLIKGLNERPVWNDVRLLLPEAGKTEIEAALNSDDLLCQRLAVGGTARNWHNNGDFLGKVRVFFDKETTRVFDTLPKGKRY